MDGTRILGILLIVAGIAGLLYGNFSYTKETHEAQFGNFKLMLAEKKEIDIPTWAGLAAVAAGVVLLVVRRK
jgi:uncharacterized membrane protein YdcZ (DUF606 family)